MPSLHLPFAETAYERAVVLAAELVDAVTLEPVTRHVRVRAQGGGAEPVANAGGRFVWLGAAAGRPRRVAVDPGELPYDAEEMDVPMPALLVRIWLRPRRGYRFPDGVTVVRGRLVESLAPQPAPVLDAEAWIEWQDESSQDWTAQRERYFVRTRGGGEFAAFLRLLAPDRGTYDSAGALVVRLGFARTGGAPHHSTQFVVGEGREYETFQVLAWDQLT